MNIAQAKQIPLAQIVEYLGGRFSHKGKGRTLVYYSPFRNEKTASFFIYEQRNAWLDYGHVSKFSGKGNGTGGDGLDLWCEYHGYDRKMGLKDTLAGLRSAFGGAALPPPTYQFYKQNKMQIEEKKEVAPRYKILKLHDKIFMQGLQDEIQRRRINPMLVRKYLKQAYVQDTLYPERKMNGFAFRNDKGGYELCFPNPQTGKSFKTSTSPKWYTTIEGADKTKALVFEGFWDFLTYLEMKKLNEPECMAYVLNSLSFSKKLCECFNGMQNTDGLKSVLLYFDSDLAGEKATHNIISILHDIIVKSMRIKYNMPKI